MKIHFFIHSRLERCILKMDTTKSENIIETNYTTIVNFNPPTPWGVGP